MPSRHPNSASFANWLLSANGMNRIANKACNGGGAIKDRKERTEQQFYGCLSAESIRCTVNWQDLWPHVWLINAWQHRTAQWVNGWNVPRRWPHYHCSSRCHSARNPFLPMWKYHCRELLMTTLFHQQQVQFSFLVSFLVSHRLTDDGGAAAFETLLLLLWPHTVCSLLFLTEQRF